MSVSSYSGVESKTLVVRQDIKEDIRGKNVLIVEDILDTGKTLYNVKEMLEKIHTKQICFQICKGKPQETVASVFIYIECSRFHWRINCSCSSSLVYRS